jgi:hypothetical protein
MSDKWVPLEGETQNKRVVSFHVGLTSAILFKYLGSSASSVISSTQTLEGSIMALDIRTNVPFYSKLPWFTLFSCSRMKPTRIRMCHSLVMNYGLYKRMEIFVSDDFMPRLACFRSCSFAL